MKNKEILETGFVIKIIAIVILSGLVGYNLHATGGINFGIESVSALEVIPKGIPEIYGNELDVSYDNVNSRDPMLADRTIGKLTAYEDMNLNPMQMERYIKIGSAISCEYCCGAKAIIFPSGERACGCAHSYAMRGLAKYLLTEHEDDFTDEEILEELGKWKVLFFPEIHKQKAQVMKDNSIELSYVNLASNKYRGIEKGQTSGGQMVGGC